MIYYGLITASSIMFSLMFLFNRGYAKECGNSVNAALKLTVGANLTGLVVLLAVNKFHFDPTLTTLLFALAATANNLLFNFCSIKSMGKINLSLYSVFSMLGGMTLPFIAGIFLFNEELTKGKIICFALIALSLLFTLEKGEKSKGKIYYAGVFVFNGLSGVISKFYSASDRPKDTDAGYSILIAICAIFVSTLLLLIFRGGNVKVTLKSAAFMGGYGVLSNVGNYLLLLALAGLPASAQYPFITGGVMILSTILCYFTDEKPKKKEIIAVALAFAGIMALVFVG